MRLDHITPSYFEGCDLKKMHRYASATLKLSSQNDLLRPKTKRETGASVRCLPRLLSEHSVVEPPDPIPNSEVKRNCADGSVAQAMQE